MDREERIDWLCKLRIWLNNVGMYKEWRAKFDQALADVIKESEQQPCEDAISRQVVMDCFKKWQPYMATRVWDFEKELSTLPSVSTEKTGRWHKKYDSIVNDYFWECDICKCGFQRDYPYCPNCGARMVEPQPYVPEINVGKMGESEEISENGEKVRNDE